MYSCRSRVGERGFTLVELLVAMTLGLVIVSAGLTTLMGAERHWQRHEDRTRALDDARDAFMTLSRELRMAVKVTPINSRKLEARTLVKRGTSDQAIDYHDIRYDCDHAGTRAGTWDCTRTDLTANTAPTTLVKGISNSDVFETSTTSRYVGIRMERWVRRAGTIPLILRGGATPRNCIDTTGLLAPCGGL